MEKNIILNNTLPLLISGLILWIVGIIWAQRKEIMIWFYKCRLKIFPVKFTVALSIQCNKQLNSGNYFNQIKNNLLDYIRQFGLTNIILINDFSDIFLFSNKEEAEEYRRKKELDLIIWGKFSNDGLKIEGENINTIELNLTYSCPRLWGDKENKIGKAVISDISHKMAIKNYWQIMENNSFEDVRIVSKNLVDISLYIIGLTSKFFGRINNSIEIFEKLYSNLIENNDKFYNLIIPQLIDCYQLIVMDVIWNRKNYARGKDFCEKIIKLDIDNYFALSNLPLFLYKLNYKQESEEAVEKLLRLYPKHSITELDVAFIRIIQKKYKNAFKHYKNLIKISNISFNPEEAIEFLEQEYKISKEPALLYGSAILYYYWSDRLLAKEDLTNFIKRANEQEYKEMYRMAKKLLNTIRVFKHTV